MGALTVVILLLCGLLFLGGYYVGYKQGFEQNKLDNDPLNDWLS